MKPLFHFPDLWKCFVKLFKHTDRVEAEDGSALVAEDNVVIDGNLAVTGEVTAGAESEWQVFENIVDKDGHKRFIEGEITGVTTTGITLTYGKWSLSGTHLMIVVALTIADETVLGNTQALAEKITLPSWVLNKLVPVYQDRIDTKNFYAYASNYTQQSLGAFIDKASDGVVIRKDQALTLTAERSVRIQFDFLVDDE